MNRSISLVAAALAVAGFVSAPAFAGEKAAAAAPAAMAKPAEKGWFMVTAPHTEAECKAAQGEMAGKAMPEGMTCYMGCMHGDHTCFTLCQADSADAAKAMIPASLAKSAKVTQVDKMTPEMMKMAHPAGK